MRKGREGKGRENMAKMIEEGGGLWKIKELIMEVMIRLKDPSRVKPSGPTRVICIKVVKEL